MWLKAQNNTNDPALIGYNYLETVKLIHGCPRTLRADMGTENVVVEELQVYLRKDYNETQRGLPPFLYGTSPGNQRIMAWWAILRKHHSQFWLNLFHGLRDRELFNGDFMDKNLTQFCFLKIIQKELDDVVNE